MTEERIVKLEELVAHQAQQIEELSDELSKQWRKVDLMERKLQMLSDHYEDLEGQFSGAPPVTKPPHY